MCIRDSQKTVQCRFESCLKIVVRHVVKDYQQGLKRRKDKEIPFCELPEIFVENFAVWDDYETDYTISVSYTHLLHQQSKNRTMSQRHQNQTQAWTLIP